MIVITLVDKLEGKEIRVLSLILLFFCHPFNNLHASIDLGISFDSSYVQKKLFFLHQTSRSKNSRGSFSIVKEAICIQDMKRYAVKCIEKKFIKMHLLEREVQIMKRVSRSLPLPHSKNQTEFSTQKKQKNEKKQLLHPNILPLIEVFEDNSMIYIVMTLIKGGELFDKVCFCTFLESHSRKKHIPI